MQNGHVFFLPDTRPVKRSGPRHLHAVKNFRIKTYYLYNCCIDSKLHWPSVLAHTQMVRATPILYEMPQVLSHTKLCSCCHGDGLENTHALNPPPLTMPLVKITYPTHQTIQYYQTIQLCHRSITNPSDKWLPLCDVSS